MRLSYALQAMHLRFYFLVVLNLEDVRKDWLDAEGSHQIRTIAEHFGVFEHLFGDAYFYPRVPLDVLYKGENGDMPVYHGNVIKPMQTVSAPTVSYEAEDNSLWTLILTNPDGHLTKANSEYVHWFM